MDLLKSIKHCLFIAGIVAVLSPVLVQLAFKMDSPHPMLVASWTAGEFLAYIGSLLGAVATIAAVMLTIEKSDEDSRESSTASLCCRVWLCKTSIASTVNLYLIS